MSEDFGLRLAQFEARIAQLERAVLERKLYPIQYQPQATGCVCPVGAEKFCGGWNCPRRAPPAVYSVSDTLTTTAIGSIPRNGSGVCKTCPPGWCGAGSESFCPEREAGKATGPG